MKKILVVIASVLVIGTSYSQSVITVDQSKQIESSVNNFVAEFLKNNSEYFSAHFDVPRNKIDVPTTSLSKAHQIVSRSPITDYVSGHKDREYNVAIRKCVDTSEDISITLYNIKGFDAVSINCMIQNHKIVHFHFTKKVCGDGYMDCYTYDHDGFYSTTPRIVFIKTPYGLSEDGFSEQDLVSCSFDDFINQMKLFTELYK